MRLPWILALLFSACAVIAAFAAPTPIWAGSLAAAAFLSLIWLWVAVVGPVKKASIGIELLKGNEYNNRLSPSHEPGANRIVKVFNGLIDRLNEERLRVLETNNLLELLVKASPMGVAIMDFDRRFTLVNDSFCRITDRTADDILGKTPAEIKLPIMAAASKLGDREETTFTGEDSEIYRISRFSFMERGFRRPFLLVEKLTEEIRRAEKDAYGKVIRTISHEVNNTLGGFSSFLETLVQMEFADEDLRELAASCLDSCSSLGRFIGNYADVVRIGEPNLDTIDYNQQLARELPFLRSLAGEEIAVELDLLEPELVLRIDPAMMRQVVVNVLKNGAESIRERLSKEKEPHAVPGEIRMVVGKERNKFFVDITDNGMGIDSQKADHLFRAFHTTKRNGQGLGLTLSAEVLRRHGFRYSLTTTRSQGPTPLTTFRITGALPSNRPTNDNHICLICCLR